MSYSIDTSHSHVQFSVRHMMISKARGSFEKFSGSVNLDTEHPENSSVDVTIDTNSVDTRDEKRDAHLRSADFFDTEKYPTMTFKSSKVKQTDSEHAKVYGDLTIKNITKTVVLNVEYQGSAKSPWGTTSYGFEARTTISRKEWDLTWNVALETGGMLVGDDINIDIELELVQVPEQQAENAA